MNRFSGKNVLITGATSGIGAACARRFAKEGAYVFAVGRDEEKGANVIDSIVNSGGKAEFIKCDVSLEEDIDLLKNKISDKVDCLDVLFNNAGIMLPSSEIERMPVDDWDATFNTNIRSMFLVTRSLKTLLKAGSCIINNGSIAGLQYYAAGRSYAYSASKAAVVQFTHQMAKNYGECGIRVNCVCPGIIDTPILGTRDRSEYAKRVPLGYVGKPKDVAGAVTFLASDDASYITGTILVVDGGVSL